MREKYLEEIETLKDILNKTNKSLEYGTSVQEVVLFVFLCYDLFLALSIFREILVILR